MSGGHRTDAQIAVTEQFCDEVMIERRIGSRVKQDARFGVVSGDKHSENAPVDQGI
jgi:hypothetical protein